jgi:hypothetical protein
MPSLPQAAHQPGIEAPQFTQNGMGEACSAAHVGQMIGSRAPQAAQNRLPGKPGSPQREQVTLSATITLP